MAETKLKPCPFCGRQGTLTKIGIMFCVRCENPFCACEPWTRYFTVEEEAVVAWNWRADDA